MLDSYQLYLNQAVQRKKAIKKKIESLKKIKDGVVDELIHDGHEQAFEKIDCLKCANCCKTTGPLFTQKDIERISKYLKLKPGRFIETYLRMDEDDDYVLKTTPCEFLGADNYCSIYEVRPKACAEYPHTDMRNQKKILNLTMKNTEMCPAVAYLMNRITDSQ